jgi:chemosensory pili system protein ChpA (sensor histidine kinase/response regulator)
MDAVRETVLSQRGVIQVKSQSGQGATFTLFLPLTLATAAVVLIQHGDKQLALPANMVEQVLQLSRSDLQLARQSGQLMWRNTSLPLYQLSLLLDNAVSSEAELSHTLNSVIVLRGVHGQLALEVEAILGNGEVVVRNIGPQASSVKGIVGASVMPDSSLALIINPLLFLTTEQQVRHAQPASSSPAAQICKVMVVDDSLTVRRVSQRLIERAGYTVLLARDGLHAIEILQTERPAIILLDIEMPRMDGFEFLHYLRQDAKTSEIPVVMITSRTAEKHRKHAMELGATAYLGKPFNETELLTLLKSFA